MNKATGRDGVWLKGYEVQVGDEIDGWRLVSDGVDLRLAVGAIVEVKKVVSTAGGETLYHRARALHFNRDHPLEWHIINRAPKYFEAPKPVSVGRWNGKCPKCGRGVYTGFVSIEHEGGPCG